ncbi:hypothetical protein SAMN05443665_10103 [Actinomadura meyerae]|jgi:hypothetical protein|uniref:Uncharacterized protein n=1 Tax=Actinomadura meyerae TaxID=240840 RepID=A0A239HJA3_9ACTN|nr:hypothetical protein [Actinomadura meyerae]SNS81420.1 hypothetical protein SAMN05443665_10103 [Actinomadura meyerae]
MSETDDLDRQAPVEANEADAAEQRAALDEVADGPVAAPLPDEANEADAAEQRLEVPVDEDDYDR